MDDRVEWLLAQIDEDERVAREAAEAKRKIVDWARRMDPMPGMGGALAGEARRILRWLAAPYSDRPGYREEWRP